MNSAILNLPPAQGAAALPRDEQERLSTLYETGILDTAPDPAFDRLTRLAAAIFGTRYAFIAYVDETRQWFKSTLGFDQRESPRETSLCGHTILQVDGMVVCDTWRDERFRENPHVCGGLALRFYAGVPVVSAEGYPVGTFCVGDTEPRDCFTEADRVALATFAEMASELTEEHRRNEELRATEQEARDRYALVARATLDGVWDWDIRRDRMFYSPRWQRILGLEERDCFATVEHWTGRIHAEDRAEVLELIERQLEGDEAPFRSEHRVLHGDGGWRWVVVRGLSERDGTGRTIRMAGSLMDVTGEKTSDSLTLLPNGLVLQDRLARLIRRSEVTGEWHFAVLFLDVDHFKEINEQFGHQAGDKVLVAVAERATAVMAGTRQNKESLVTRMSGDQFVVLIDGVRDARQAEAVAGRLQRAIGAPVEIDAERIEPRVSIGIAMGVPQFKTPESFLHNADLAMYQAKAAGKAAATVFDLRMLEENLRRLKTETLLRRAVAQGEMRVFYQPQIDLKTGELVGCEALVRWQHPELGMVPPDTFIPIAERIGVIGELDQWVMRTAARQIAEWRGSCPAAMNWHMSVNVSAEKFPNPQLLQSVQETLAHFGLPASVLCMEITETALMRQVGHSEQAMQALRTIGVGLHMDDFGSGYSSFKQLYDLPFDTLKIDRSFLNRIIGNEKAISVVRGILSLAKTLGLSSIAEGIETQEQEELLRSLGCEWGQGYLYSRPVDAETFARRYMTLSAA